VFWLASDLVCYLCVYLIVAQLDKDLEAARLDLSQRSHALNQAEALKEDLVQRQHQERSQAEQEIGSAEGLIQSQKDTIHRLQQELATVSLALVTHCRGKGRAWRGRGLSCDMMFHVEMFFGASLAGQMCLRWPGF